MTEYLRKSFTVSQRGRDPAHCAHTWLNQVQRFCVECGRRFTPEEWATLTAPEAP